MLSQDRKYLDKTLFTDLFILNGYDFIFFANNSGNIIYSQFSDSNNTTNASTFSEINRKIIDKSLLCKEAENPLKGFLMLENSPAIISCRPVLAAPDSKEIIGTIILGKNLDADFIESVQEYYGKLGFTLQFE